jgi:hypothetical protein
LLEIVLVEDCARLLKLWVGKETWLIVLLLLYFILVGLHLSDNWSFSLLLPRFL